MLEMVETWTQRLRNGHLPSYLGWLAYKYKLWPSVRYGIGVMTNDVEDIDHLLDKRDYKTMNYLGVASSIKAGWRKYTLPLVALVFSALLMSRQ